MTWKGGNQRRLGCFLGNYYFSILYHILLNKGFSRSEVFAYEKALFISSSVKSILEHSKLLFSVFLGAPKLNLTVLGTYTKYFKDFEGLKLHFL